MSGPVIGAGPLNRLEIERLLRMAREYRDNLQGTRLMLEERHAKHGDGAVREAILVAGNDVYLLEQIIAKLWSLII